MPTYEYSCKECGEHLEVVQSFHDDALTKCPSCGGELKKVFGNIGIVFKGSGFYKTDSRSTSSAAKTTPSSEPATGGAAESKADGAKEAPKTEPKKDSAAPAASTSTPAAASSTAAAS